jgi:arginine decarboxylase
LHSLKPNEDYLIGVFLVGAYQETLGDLHNLFGDTNVATVHITEGGHLEFLHEIHGDSIADVLQYVEYQPDRLYEQFRTLAEDAVKSGWINLQQRQKMLNLFSDSLRGFTYFEQT